MKQYARYFYFTVFAAFLLISGCSQQQQVTANPEVQRLAARADGVTIIRDDFGVPHIYGKTDADAVFGLLYAQAEDDFPRVERNYIWAIGRLAEVDGEEAIFSDLRAHLYMTVDEAKADYESAPAWLKKLCDAFADGLNYYLATHPEVKPRLLTHFEPWMPMFFFEGSIGGDIERIPVDGIKAFYGSKQSVKAKNEAQVRRDGFQEPVGSNGIAISGKLTKSGNAMLLINPHTSFYFRGEVHVVSEEGLNAYGAVTWGQFFVYQGFNENAGWMHSTTHGDYIDDFVEDVFKKNGKLMYRYGDEIRPVEVSEVTLKYKDGDKMSERTLQMYHTHHGPITHMLNGKWVATEINWDPVNALRQSYLRTKAGGQDEFRDIMNIRSNSSNNTMYADSQGNIAYYHGNFMPIRSSKFDYSKPVDGSNPATDWQGASAVDDMITILNPPNNWIQNCNSTPFTAAGKFSPKREDYPVYMARDPQNFRAIHAVRLLKKASDLTLDKLIKLAYDPYLPGLEQIIPGLVQAFDKSGQDYPELADAIDVLRNWNFRVSADSVAMSLAHFYGTRYIEVGKNPQNLSGMNLINYFGTGSPYGERLRIFAATITELKANFGQWNTVWGEINRLQRLNGDIEQHFNDDEPSLPVGMASSVWGALASFGTQKDHQETKRIYGVSGNSFIAVVEFGDKVSAKTLLVGGQSGDPDSPHFDDQTQRYIDVKFKDAAFYREDVERRATRTYHPGK